MTTHRPRGPLRRRLVEGASKPLVAIHLASASSSKRSFKSIPVTSYTGHLLPSMESTPQSINVTVIHFPSPHSA